MFRTVPITLSALVALVAMPHTANAQVEVGTDLGVFSHYVWRGITFTSDPVAQQDIWVSISGFTVGAWGNIEVIDPDATGLSLRGPDNRGVGEVDYWAEYARTVGPVDLAAGGIYYTFLGLPGSGDGNTTELYVSAGFNGLPVQPSAALYYDVDNVSGLYAEAAVAYTIPFSQFGVDVGATAGFSAGQEPNTSNLTQAANFASGGFTHVDFSAGAELSAGPVTFGPAFHVLINIDDNTRITGATLATQRSKVWFGTSISWSRAVR